MPPLTVPKPERPELEEVVIKTCKVDNKEYKCLEDIKPLILNDQRLKAFINELLAAPCWR